jgi:hypothetical protein
MSCCWLSFELSSNVVCMIDYKKEVACCLAHRQMVNDLCKLCIAHLVTLFRMVEPVHSDLNLRFSMSLVAATNYYLDNWWYTSTWLLDLAWVLQSQLFILYTIGDILVDNGSFVLTWWISRSTNSISCTYICVVWVCVHMGEYYTWMHPYMFCKGKKRKGEWAFL